MICFSSRIKVRWKLKSRSCSGTSKSSWPRCPQTVLMLPDGSDGSALCAQTQQITPQLALQVLLQFDKAINAALASRVRNRVNFRVSLRSCVSGPEPVPGLNRASCFSSGFSEHLPVLRQRLDLRSERRGVQGGHRAGQGRQGEDRRLRRKEWVRAEPQQNLRKSPEPRSAAG